MSKRVAQPKWRKGDFDYWFWWQSDFHCYPEIQADAYERYQITGREYLPGDLIECSCGKFWVIDGVIRGGTVRLYPYPKARAKGLLGLFSVRWKDAPVSPSR